MEIHNPNSAVQTSQFSGASQVDNQKQGWRSGQIAGKIASAFGFKASVASSAQQGERAQNMTVTKEAIEGELEKIDAQIAKTLKNEKLMLTIGYSSSLKEHYQTSLRDLAQQRGVFALKLANEDYTLPVPAQSTSSTPASSAASSRSNSPDASKTQSSTTQSTAKTTTGAASSIKVPPSQPRNLKKEAQNRLAAIDEELRKLPTSIQEPDPLKKELIQARVKNTRAALEQEKSELSKKLLNNNF